MSEWKAPQTTEYEPSYEELHGALDRLRDAASSLVSEIDGTVMHLRACFRLSDMREPLREAWCVLHKRPYEPLPKPPTESE